MDDVARFQGTSAFGQAYQCMLDRDPHAPGTVDRLLLANTIRLLPETADHLYSSFSPLTMCYSHGSRPRLEGLVHQLTSGSASPSQALDGIVTFTASLSQRAPEDIDALIFGGTEEEIIERGSDWCTDVARVACALCQVAGIPARIVYLFDLSRAYSTHAIVEAYHFHTWGAVDPLTAVRYSSSDGTPVTTWTLMNDPDLVRDHRRRHTHAVYTYPGQFSAAAIAGYEISLAATYDYSASKVNQYYRSVLQMAAAGWPGGLRWLHGEETS